MPKPNRSPHHPYRSVNIFFNVDLSDLGAFPIFLLEMTGSIRRFCGQDVPASSCRFCMSLMSGSLSTFSCFFVSGGGRTRWGFRDDLGTTRASRGDIVLDESR